MASQRNDSQASQPSDEGVALPVAPPVIDGAESNKELLGGPPPPVAPAPAQRVKPGTLVVAPGLSISCPRGNLDAGTPVTHRDFAVHEKDEVLGRAALEDLIARGAVVKS